MKIATLIAAHIPIAFAVWCAVRSFWAFGPEVFVACLALFAALTFLLSVSVKAALERFDEEGKRALVMGIAICLLGAFFFALDATLTHSGLQWLITAHPGLFPDWALIPMSVGLAFVNLSVKWAYLAPSRKPETEAEIATSASSKIAEGLRVVG